ncbi:MAG: hypothetical protein MUO77_06375, partial [Anaerolineales bacterium]|nr:hypothetical protein [Anaerolineales bacterium]
MKNKTGGIIATLATLALCGLPGFILLCMGAAGIITPRSPDSTTTGSNFLIIVGGQICLGIVFLFIPLVVGFFTLRNKSTPDPVAPAVYTSTPVYQAPAPVAPASQTQTNSGGMDASIQAVYDRIMALNRPTAPYQIIDGRAKGVDLIAEWKIVDAQWYEIFAKA